jgi:hypothetical protein
MMIFHATRQSNEKVAVVRIPLVDGSANTFIFQNSMEMYSTLLERYEPICVDTLIDDLDIFGSAYFSA